MDAPHYPPATVYVAPERIAYVVTTNNTPIADLMAIPAAKAVIIKEIPGIEARLSVPQLKPHLGNFSFRSLVQWGFSTTEQLDRVDDQLRALGEIK